MAIIRRNDAEAECDVQMTSMMDLVFLLLIFFIVTASLKRPEKVLPITPPNATHAKETRLHNETVITIDAQGNWYVFDGKKNFNQTIVKQGEMLTILQAIKEQGEETPIRLDVDKDAKFIHVMPVIDSMAFYQIRNIHIKSQHAHSDNK